MTCRAAAKKPLQGPTPGRTVSAGGTVGGKTNACSYCHRTFGSHVTWRGRPVYLRRERDHVIPKANGGKRILPACHICNRIKGSLTFDSISAIQDFCLDALLKDGSATLKAVPLKVAPTYTCACGNVFTSWQPKVRNCSPECTWKAWDADHPRVKLESADEWMARKAAELSGRPRPQRLPLPERKAGDQATCPVCGNSSRTRGVFCGDRCRLIAWAAKQITAAEGHALSGASAPASDLACIRAAL